jgi:hypothetical protein
MEVGFAKAKDALVTKCVLVIANGCSKGVVAEIQSCGAIIKSIPVNSSSNNSLKLH